MKLCVIQPPYPASPEYYASYHAHILNALDHCDIKADLILLPESSNAPGPFPNLETFHANVKRRTAQLLEKVKMTAIRCNSMVAVNLITECENGFRNTTLLYARNGSVEATYYKQHMPYSEKSVLKLDTSYTLEYNPPVVTEAEGIKIGFLTCYDMYFNEYFVHLADKRPDLILVSSHQRGERPDIIEMQAKNCAFTCNSYLLRASVSMGESSATGGCSMLVAPDGVILKNYHQSTGTFYFDVDDIKYKYLRPNGFGQALVRNDEFISSGRTPWAYRSCGSSTKPTDADTVYPRVCSHRGFNTVLPENTIPALALAISLGADEIAIDVRPTSDGVFILCNDDTIDRVSDGSGRVSDMTYEQITSFDIGTKCSNHLKGLRFPRLEDVLKSFSRQVIINLQVISLCESGKDDIPQEYDCGLLSSIIELVYKYDCVNHTYITGTEDVMATALKLAPEIARCYFAKQHDLTPVETAGKYECRKLQLHSGCYTPATVVSAHMRGIRCNYYWSDIPGETIGLLTDGVDTILTNDFLNIATMVRTYRRR